MFYNYFSAASVHLRHVGWSPLIVPGQEVTEDDLEAVDQSTDRRMPIELRRFYLELGDAFRFEPDHRPDAIVNGWSPMRLEDHAIHNIGFAEQIQEEAFRETASMSPGADITPLREEVERRKQWIPFYGFTGGGDLLCLDALGRVRFYEALHWKSTPETWSFLLADSFSGFVEKWSQYCFVTPGGSWTSFCIGRSGLFDWLPKHFLSVAVRPE